ncbi:MAG: hypothetical protein IKB64_05195 [Paludibacteraceae bacterium]|nr:hypothetical protein [Paludibacteraceae bacterium]
MNTAYVIKEESLQNIANAIRHMDETTDEIAVENYPDRIKQLKPTTEDYMRISDLLNYPEPINEANYTEEEVAKCQALIDFYTEMEG